jgi:hypothetical protein
VPWEEHGVDAVSRQIRTDPVGSLVTQLRADGYMLTVARPGSPQDNLPSIFLAGCDNYMKLRGARDRRHYDIGMIRHLPSLAPNRV